MKYCKNCGAELADDAVVCTGCGTQLTEEQQPLKKNVMAIVGFVLSLVALFVNLYAIPAVVGLVLSIVGLVQIKKGGYMNKKLAIAGIVLSAIAIFWDIMYYAFIGPMITELLNSIM